MTDWQDSIYLKSAGGMSVGGWRTKSLPYIVELDNCKIMRTSVLACVIVILRMCSSYIVAKPAVAATLTHHNFSSCVPLII